MYYLLILAFGIIFVMLFILIKRSDKRIENLINTDNHTLLLKKYDDIDRIMGEFLRVPDIDRTSIMRSNSTGADPRMGDDYIMSVIMSKGKKKEEIKETYKTAVISRDYASMLIDLVEKKEGYYVVSKLNEGWLKETCRKNDTKEFLLFYLASKRDEVIYGAVIGNFEGSINNHREKINKIIKKLRNLYK